MYVNASTAIFSLPYSSVNSNDPFGNGLVNGAAVVGAIARSICALLGIVALQNTTKNRSSSTSSEGI